MKIDPNQFKSIQSKKEILSSIEKSRDEIFGYISSINASKFLEKPQSGWSGEENLRHLVNSGNTILLGIVTPRILTRIIFGRASRKPRSYVQIIEVYQKRIQQGRGAGIFTPVKTSSSNDGGRKKEKLLRKWNILCDRLLKLLEKWTEDELDTYRLPHPILGLLTVREMLFFFVYHNYHHISKLEKRLGQ